MKIIDRYKPILKQFWELLDNEGDDIYIMGYLYFDESFKDLILEDIDESTFLSLYPNIIMALYNEGYKVDSLSDDYELMDYFLKNRLKLAGTDEYQNLRVFVNSFFGNLTNQYKDFNVFGKKIGIKIAKMVCFYTSLILNDIRNLNQNKIIYIDVDSIFHIGDLEIGDLSLPTRDIIDVTALCIERKKKYKILTNGEYKSKGYIRINKKDIENVFKQTVRDRQLRKLGI